MMKTILILLLTCVAAVAQQTVNNFSVKTNLFLRGLNVSTQLTPVPVELSTNWFNIATWGDSLTAGTGASPSSNAYPATLGLLSGYTVSNGGVGGETSGEIETRMVADTASHVQPTIIWAGRNDVYTNSAANIISNIDAMIAALAAAGNSNRWLVLNVLNGDYVPYDAIGGVGYGLITNLNEQMRVHYGARYVPIREALVAAYDPGIPADVTDHSLDIPPGSLRSDAIHLNNDGYAAVANYVLTNYQSVLRGEWPAFVSAKGLQIELASPPPIGITTANTGSFSDLYSPFVRVGGTANYKTFSLSGDFSSVQLNGNMIPLSHNANDVGYNSALAWRNGYFAGTVYGATFEASTSVTSPFASISEVVTPLLRVGTVPANSTITRAADGSIQFGSSLIFGPDSTYSIGTDTGQNRPLHGYFAGNLYADVHYGNSATITNITSTGTLTLTNSANSARILSDTDYRGYKFTSGALGAGATADLLTIGSYAKVMSGILTVRTWSASSRGLYTYVLGIMGGGDAATITPTSFQQYGPTALTGTLTIVKDTPSGGTDTIRFTVGANALTAIEFAWKPMLVDGSSTITGF